MNNLSKLSIAENEEFYWGSIITVKAAEPGDYDVRLAYRILDKNSKFIDNNYYYATICPYFDIIMDEIKDVADILIILKTDPFNKDARQRLNDHAFLNNPPLRKVLKMKFEESSDLKNKLIWFCDKDDLKSGASVSLAAVEFELNETDRWRFNE